MITYTVVWLLNGELRQETYMAVKPFMLLELGEFIAIQMTDRVKILNTRHIIEMDMVEKGDH